MSQTSISSYYNTRKRAIGNVENSKSKVFLAACDSSFPGVEQALNSNCNNKVQKVGLLPFGSQEKKPNVALLSGELQGIPSTSVKCQHDIERKHTSKRQICTFSKKAFISPRKIASHILSAPTLTQYPKNNLQIPTANNTRSSTHQDEVSILVQKELCFEDVKKKISRSSKLSELKISLSRIRVLEERRAQQEVNNRDLAKKECIKRNDPRPINLKEFKNIELEFISSPKKGLSTPIKSCSIDSEKDELMTRRINTTPKRVLLSPTKEGFPSALPAYQRYYTWTVSGENNLQLPYSYRCLMEVFKCLDTVCAMFYNRKEIITFKKLKSTVQRMLRRNFSESHLAQIKSLYPEAFKFSQQKIRNFGSTSKQDYYQLVITPNVTKHCYNLTFNIDEDTLKLAPPFAMNPQIIIARQQKFYHLLLDKVKAEHDLFLKSLDPPLNISKEKVKYWHPEFNLESCPQIDNARLPQPPNLEKYSSARDILFTARNLFNSTALVDPIETKKETDYVSGSEPEKNQVRNMTTDILKNVPKSLVEKIRAKQATKAVNIVTKQTQGEDPVKNQNLPKLALHLRSVFITEKKNILPLEIIIKRINNSFYMNMEFCQIEVLLRLMARECPKWIQFHEIRQTIYVKLDRNADLKEMINILKTHPPEK